MIYILDNGNKYSDHAIVFLRSDVSLDRMAAIIDAVNAGDYQSTWTILGHAERIEWREATLYASLESWLPVDSLLAKDGETPNAALFDLMGSAWWETFLRGQVESEWGDPKVAELVRAYLATKGER
jgi:hypothetical protein